MLVVDGHTLHRVGLTHPVRHHPDSEIVGEATTAADAITMVAALQPDVVTVDVALSGQNGLALARELRDRQQSLGIVVLTSPGEDDVLFRAMETGVSAFVPKTAPEEEIITAIRHAAVAASAFTAPGLLAALDRLREAREQSPLTRREIDVLRQLHRCLSIPEVARAVREHLHREDIRGTNLREAGGLQPSARTAGRHRTGRPAPAPLAV